jgi:LETM1 and EF-hand domain-containing protein 1
MSCVLRTDSFWTAHSENSAHGRRPIVTTPDLWSPKTAIKESKSTVEQAVETLKAKKAKPPVVEAKIVEVKKSLWERAKQEALHYYNGFKLLFYDVKISSRLLWKSMRGQTLTRRERRQVHWLVLEARFWRFKMFVTVTKT